MMKIKTTLLISLLWVLGGCGGGSASVEVNGTPVSPPFLFWSGSSSGDQVIDGNNHVFAFYADTGCLYNFQTARENTAFCIFPRSNVVAYGPFRGQILSVLSSAGICVAAIVDALTGNFADIEVDAFGREVVVTTLLHPALCI
jgi:hypothetical protein